METVGVMCKNFTLFLLEAFGSFGGIIGFIIFAIAMLLVFLVVLYVISVLDEYIHMNKDIRRYRLRSKKLAVRCFFLNLRWNVKELFR